MIFQEFLSKLLTNPSQDTKLSIKGKIVNLVGLSKLTSFNYKDKIGYYYKAFFSDGSLLVIIPSLEDISFASSEIGRIESVPDEIIGKQEIIEYNNKQYKLDNGNDYQYTIELVVGSLKDSEGECSFSDYININDEGDCLSLGWLSYNNKRADVNTQTISLEDIKIL